MGKIKDPPKFSLDKPYDQWKTEVALWQLEQPADNADTSKHAITIALAMPETGCNDVRARILASVKLFETDAQGKNTPDKDAFKNLVAFLDNEFKKDTTLEMCELIDKWLDTSRADHANLKEYINAYDFAYKKAKKAGLPEMPQEFLMQRFMKGAKLDDKDFKFVLSSVDTAKKATLYEQTKEAMTKYFGQHDAAPNILEPSTKSEIETMWAGGGGYRGSHGGGGGFRGGSRGGFRGGGQRGGGYGGGQGGPLRAEGIAHGNIYGRIGQGQRNFRKLNPRSKDGKLYPCWNCGGLTHLAKNCPEQGITLVVDHHQDVAGLEDQIKCDYVVRGIQEETLYNQDPNNQLDPGYDMNAVDQFSNAMGNMNMLGDANDTEVGFVTLDTLYTVEVLLADIETKDDAIKAVLDTGAVSSVTGKDVMNAIISKMEPRARKLVKASKSTKTFKFGGGERRKSLGHYAVPISIGNDHNIILYTDVVDAPIPCLISKAAIKAAQSVIDTRDDTITMYNRVKIKLSEVPAGHYGIPIQPFRFRDQDPIFSPRQQKPKDNLEDEDWEILMMENEEPELSDTFVELPNAETDDEKEVEKKVKHMHEQLGHPSKAVFTRMLTTTKIMKDGNSKLSTYVNKLYESCPTCIQFTKSKPRPKVSPPLATRFNQTLSLDLKVWPEHDLIILYIVDDFTRFMQGHPIEDKKPETIVRVLLDEWILKMFGCPESIRVDNGGEFMNHIFKEATEKLGIKLISTGANSPWQNGLVERNHMVVDTIISKMMRDQPEKSAKQLINHAVFAKNCLVNVSGYVPMQLVFGSIPRLPGVPYNQPPANETIVRSEVLADRLQDMYTTRQTYMEAENSARLKRSLLSKMPAPKMINYQNGQKVLYKHGKDNQWHGPATVIGTDNKVIFLRQGRFILASSQSRVIPADGTETQPAPPAPEQSSTPSRNLNDNGQEEGRKADSDSDTDSDTEADTDETPETPEPPQHQFHQQQQQQQDDTPDFGDQRQDFQIQDTAPPNEQDTPPTPPPMPPRPHTPSPRPQTRDNKTLTDEALSPRTRANREVDRMLIDVADLPDIPDPNKIPKLPKFRRPEKDKTLRKGMTIFCRKKADRHKKSAWYKIRTVEKTRKTTTVNKMPTGPYWTVIRDEDDEAIGWYEWSHDWYEEGEERPDWIQNYVAVLDSDDESEDESPDFDPTYVVLIPSSQHRHPEVVKAKEREINNFKAYKAFEEVKDEGQERCTSGWVVTEKIMGDGKKGVKARLVIHGNQLSEQVDSDSPTVRKVTMRIMITLAVQYGWKLQSSDVTAAFLQSEVMVRKVHANPPPEARRPGMLWLLLRPMYGLDEAGRCWYITVDLYLATLGGKKCTADPACWVFHHDNKFIGFICLHVDDALHAGAPRFHEHVLKPLFNKFKFGLHQEGDFKVLGWNLRALENGEVAVSQKDYVEAKLKTIDVAKKTTDKLHYLLNEVQTKRLRSAVGALRWMADQTRPDASFACLHLNCVQLNPTFRDVKLYNNTVNNIKNNNYELVFRKLKPDNWRITVFTDASFNNLPPDKSGTGGGFITFLSNGFVQGERNRCNILSWKCTKLDQACTNTTEAETIAMANAFSEADMIKEIIMEATLAPEDLINVEVFCDSKNAIENAKSLRVTDKILPFRGYTAKVRQALNTGKVRKLEQVGDEFQIADNLTKLTSTRQDLITTLTQGRFFV